MDIINPYIHGGEALAFNGFGNRSRNFNGVDDYISIADNADIPTGAQTICCWVKFNTLNSGSSGQDLITHWTTIDSNNASFAIYMPNAGNGKVRFYVSADGQTHVNVAALDAISAFEWSHVACVFTPNDSIKIYINGSLSNTLATTGISSLYNSSVDLVLGGRDQVSVTTPLNGNLADCRIYDTDLTANEISDIYNGTNITTNLVGHWLTDADNVLDAAGTNHGTNYGSKYSYDNPSPPVEFGSASRSFNGTSNYVNTNASFNNVFNSNFTFACWVKCDDGQPTTTNSIFGNQNNNPVSRFLCGVLSNGARVAYYNVDGNVCITQTQATLSNGQSDWFHFVVTITPSGNSIYLDGSLQALDATNNGDMSGLTMGDYNNSTANCFIGARSFNNSPDLYVDGNIADVRIYDAKLTASQVSDLYAGTDVQTNLVGHWLTDNDDVEDKAGTNDGTNFGSTYSYDNPPMDLIPSRQASRSFDGSSDYVNLGQTTDNAIFTASAWVKFNSHNSSLGEGIFGKWQTANDASWLIYTRPTPAGNFTFIVRNGIDNTNYICDSGIGITIGQWTHITGVADGTNLNIYVNGVSAASIAYDGTIHQNQSIDTNIGAYNNTINNQHFVDGKIADVRIYDTDLTAAQILAIYNGTTDRTNLVGQWLTNSDDVLDHAGTNDGTNNGSTYSTDSPS